MQGNYLHPDIHPSFNLPHGGAWPLPRRAGLFPYDSAQYAAALRHLGTPLSVSGWPVTILRSPMPGMEELQAAAGPWPFCSPPGGEQARELRANLARQKLVSFKAVFRPDVPIPLEALKKAGFEILSQKDHFVFDPHLDQPSRCAKMRYDIKRAQRNWSVESISLADYQCAISRYYALAAKENGCGSRGFLPPAHFAALVDLPDTQVLGAFDAEGLGAALITMHWEGNVYFHAMVGAPRAYHSCGFHALYDRAIEGWGQSRTLYFGGVPDGLDGPEVARFKGRFSNRRVPVFSASIVLNADAIQPRPGTHASASRSLS